MCLSEIKLCEAKNYRDFILKCYWMLILKSEWWMIIIECSQQAAEWKEWHKAQTCIKVNVITKYTRSRRIYMHYWYCVKLPYTVKPDLSDTCAIHFPVLSDIDFHALLTIFLCVLHCKFLSFCTCQIRPVLLYFPFEFCSDFCFM